MSDGLSFSGSDIERTKGDAVKSPVSAAATASSSSAVQREVGSAKQVLAEQAAGVLARPALPGALRFGEVHRGMPVSTLNAACWATSLPRIQVSDRRSYWGRVVIVDASAFFIVTAP